MKQMGRGITIRHGIAMQSTDETRVDGTNNRAEMQCFPRRSNILDLNELQSHFFIL